MEEILMPFFSFATLNGPQTVYGTGSVFNSSLIYTESSKRRLLATFASTPDIWTENTGYYDFDLAAWVEAFYSGWDGGQTDKRLHGIIWNPTASELWAVSWNYRYMAKSIDHGATWVRWGSYLNINYTYHLHWLTGFGGGAGCMILGTCNSGGTGAKIWRWTGSVWQSIFDFGGTSKPVNFIGESDNYLLVCTNQDSSGSMIQRWNENDLSGRTVVGKYSDFNGTPLSIFWDSIIGQYLVGASGKIFQSNAGETSGPGNWVQKSNIADLGIGWTGAYAHCAGFIRVGLNVFCLCFMTDNLGSSDPQGWILLHRKADGSWEIEKHWNTIAEPPSGHMYQDVYWGKPILLFESKIIASTNVEE